MAATGIDADGEFFDPNNNFLMSIPPPPPGQGQADVDYVLHPPASYPEGQILFGGTPESGSRVPSLTTKSATPTSVQQAARWTVSNVRDNRKNFLLRVSRRPAKNSSTEKKGYQNFEFDGFEEFKETFETWMSSVFTDPPFCWKDMDLYNDNLQSILSDTDEVIDDLDGTFTHYNKQKAVLYLIMKEKGKGTSV
ncbi:hypothetical protein ABW20_dc0106137 [Dactylellina cionopaga]|nr:hypothetical protein ABW20_dc0106137 [Dactylellina cionopaga]